MPRMAIFSLVLVGALVTALTGSVGADVRHDNGRIAFVGNAAGDNDIYTVDPDGTDVAQLTFNADFDFNDTEPAVSPDGSKIAFTSDRDGDPDIFVMNADGSDVTQLTDESDAPFTFVFPETQPTFSPDGTKIAFVTRRVLLGNPATDWLDIYVMDADGSNMTRLTDAGAALGATPKSNIYPTFSPDGSKIYFTSNRDGNLEIYSMNADGSDETRLTNDASIDFGPTVSPDSATIAYASDRDTGVSGGWQIRTMNVDGTDDSLLSDGTFLEYDPSYSPDGSRIAVTSYRAGGSQTEIWTMDADGGDPTRVTDLDGLNSTPDWGTAGGVVTCTLTGGNTRDNLRGTSGDDVICGLGGPDRINGRGGDDVLYGDTGDDQLTGDGGTDELNGAGGFDTANFNPGATQGVDVDLSTHTVANDGNGFAETITGVQRVEGARNQVNVLVGDDADNKLIGGLLDDELDGGDGADLLRGEPERVATGGDDILNGGNGDDELFPGLAFNFIDGGAGSDTLNYSAMGVGNGVDVDNSDGAGDSSASGALSDTFTGIENVTGTPFSDIITVEWNGVANFVRGREGDDTLSTVDGDALDTMNGGSGGTNICDNTDVELTIHC